MTPSRRKKWTEAEERTLIGKYEEMVCNGTLGKLRTREKKFKPIACHVNNMHHILDPVGFPWQWTWKDVSTKVQNMRHQYLLVKQKIKKPLDSSREEFDWLEGSTHWSNFLRYKEVFGDAPLVSNGIVDPENGGEAFAVAAGGSGMEFGQHSGDVDFGVGLEGADDDGMVGLGFEYEAGDAEDIFNGHDGQLKNDGGERCPYEEDANESTSRKKRKTGRRLEKKALGFLAHQLNQLKKLESQFEKRETEREKERQRRDAVFTKLEQERLHRLEEREKHREELEKAREELTKQRKQQWEAREKDSDAKERKKEAQLVYENEWEERLNRRRLESMKQMDEMLSQHRAEMGQVQARILHEQQNLTNQLLGIVAQWTGHSTVLSDPAGQNSHYFSQMMHQEGGIVHETRVDGGDNQGDQFIVD